jgi:putative ABC transport system permease protein
VFTSLAVFISCLGIFGLASFTAEQRAKEIGIRKILGASVATLWRMLASEFVQLVLLACLLAIPVAYYFTTQWLAHYAYHTEITWLIFFGTAASAVVITILTISYQAIKTAVANPVRSLRSE